MGYGFEKDDPELVQIDKLAPVVCPCCGKPLEESETGNRVCRTNFPPCCYMYWNRKEKKNYWKEGYGPEDIYDENKKVWLKKEPTETLKSAN